MTDTAKVESNAENKQETTTQTETVKETDYKELATHLQEEVNKWKNEAKNAFNKRDKTNDEMRLLKDQDQVLAHFDKIKAENDSLKNELLTVRVEAERKTKLDALQRVAKEQGIKERYLCSLDKFVNLDEINTEKPVTMRFAVETVKSSFPDFFGVPGEQLDKQIPTPKPVTSVKETLQKQYQDELNKSYHERDMKKLIDLKKMIEEA